MGSKLSEEKEDVLGEAITGMNKQRKRNGENGAV